MDGRVATPAEDVLDEERGVRGRDWEEILSHFNALLAERRIVSFVFIGSVHGNSLVVESLREPPKGNWFGGPTDVAVDPGAMCAMYSGGPFSEQFLRAVESHMTYGRRTKGCVNCGRGRYVEAEMDGLCFCRECWSRVVDKVGEKIWPARVAADEAAKPKPRKRSPRKSLSARTRFAVLERDGFRCHYCGRMAPDVELHVDHIVPKSKGGEDDMGNLIAACADCNLGKKDSMLFDAA